MKDIQEIINYYNDFVKAWYENPVEFIEDKAKNIFAESYRGGIKLSSEDKEQRHQLIADALPEPYLGDPYKCSAVFINLNPGGVMEKQQLHSNGEFITEGKAALNYYEFAKNFPYQGDKYSCNGGVIWWNQRKKWINRLLSTVKESDNFVSKLEPFAVELCPWHSLGFAGFRQNDRLKTYMKEYIFDFVAQAIKNSELGFGISVGKAIKNLLIELDFEANEIKNDNAPRKKDNSIINREYCYFKLPNGKILLNTWAPGSNKMPSPAWNDFEKDFINNILK